MNWRLAWTFIDQTETTYSAIFWSLVLLAILVVTFAVVKRLKKYFRDEEDPFGQSTGFTLSDLRRLHKSGHISREEFERAKAMVVKRAMMPPAQTPAPMNPSVPPPPPFEPPVPSEEIENDRLG